MNKKNPKSPLHENPNFIPGFFIEPKFPFRGLPDDPAVQLKALAESYPETDPTQKLGIIMSVTFGEGEGEGTDNTGVYVYYLTGRSPKSSFDVFEVIWFVNNNKDILTILRPGNILSMTQFDASDNLLSSQFGMPLGGVSYTIPEDDKKMLINPLALDPVLLKLANEHGLEIRPLLDTLLNHIFEEIVWGDDNTVILSPYITQKPMEAVPVGWRGNIAILPYPLVNPYKHVIPGKIELGNIPKGITFFLLGEEILEKVRPFTKKPIMAITTEKVPNSEAIQALPEEVIILVENSGKGASDNPGKKESGAPIFYKSKSPGEIDIDFEIESTSRLQGQEQKVQEAKYTIYRNPHSKEIVIVIQTKCWKLIGAPIVVEEQEYSIKAAIQDMLSETTLDSPKVIF